MNPYQPDLAILTPSALLSYANAFFKNHPNSFPDVPFTHNKVYHIIIHKGRFLVLNTIYASYTHLSWLLPTAYWPACHGDSDETVDEHMRQFVETYLNLKHWEIAEVKGLSYTQGPYRDEATGENGWFVFKVWKTLSTLDSPKVGYDPNHWTGFDWWNTDEVLMHSGVGGTDYRRLQLLWQMSVDVADEECGIRDAGVKASAKHEPVNDTNLAEARWDVDGAKLGEWCELNQVPVAAFAPYDVDAASQVVEEHQQVVLPIHGGPTRDTHQMNLPIRTGPSLGGLAGVATVPRSGPPESRFLPHRDG